MIKSFINLIKLKNHFVQSFSDSEFKVLSLLVFVCLGIGTLFYRVVEGWSWIDCMYFSMVTLTTVGYGDLTPTSPLSKLFTMVYIMIGLGIFLVFVNTLSRRIFKVDKNI